MITALAISGYSGTPLAAKLGPKDGIMVAAIDDVWSGLELVNRKERRA